jgi:transketolase
MAGTGTECWVCALVLLGWSSPSKRLVRLGLRDTFAHGASKHYLMKEYELDAMALIRAIEKSLNTSFRLTPTDLQAVRMEAVHSAAKAEAL